MLKCIFDHQFATPHIVRILVDSDEETKKLPLEPYAESLRQIPGIAEASCNARVISVVRQSGVSFHKIWDQILSALGHIPSAPLAS